MNRIEKKIWPEYFEAVRDGSKTYELRLADFTCRPGDMLVLKEWDPKTKQFTGREVEKTVSYVGRTKDYHFWPKEEVDKYGYQIIGFGV